MLPRTPGWTSQSQTSNLLLQPGIWTPGSASKSNVICCCLGNDRRSWAFPDCSCFYVAVQNGQSTIFWRQVPDSLSHPSPYQTRCPNPLQKLITAPPPPYTNPVQVLCPLYINHVHILCPLYRNVSTSSAPFAETIPRPPLQKPVTIPRPLTPNLSQPDSLQNSPRVLQPSRLWTPAFSEKVPSGLPLLLRESSLDCCFCYEGPVWTAAVANGILDSCFC